MILEKLSNKVNPKNNIHRSIRKVEIDKSPDKIGSTKVRGEGRVEGEEEWREELEGMG